MTLQKAVHFCDTTIVVSAILAIHAGVYALSHVLRPDVGVNRARRYVAYWGHDVRVLIVDDSPLICARVRMLLESVERLDVIGEARDGHGAMKLFDEMRPDALVLDLGIPGKSGYEVLRHVKTGEPGAVVIILTSHSDPFVRDRCLAGGADFFLDKATEFEMVAPIFKRLVEQRE